MATNTTPKLPPLTLSGGNQKLEPAILTPIAGSNAVLEPAPAKKSYTPEEIAAMSPARRSTEWFGADDTTRELLHRANEMDLNGTHTFDAGSGRWNPITNPTGINGNRLPVYTVNDVSALAGGYNFDENKIRNMFNEATQAEYAAKKAANETAQNQYAGNVGGYITTLSDTMRESLNKAVATGGSRGLAAAQAMQAAQDATLQTADEASALSRERMQLGYDEAEAYAKNAKDAEALAHNRRTAAMDQATQLTALDVQDTAARLGVLGNYWYGGYSGLQNSITGRYTSDNDLINGIYGTDVSANVDMRGQSMTYDTNLRAQLIGAMQSSNMTEEGRKFLEQFLGFPEGSFQNAPTPTYSGGYGGGSGGGGGYGGSGNPNANMSSKEYAASQWAKAGQYLLAGDRDGYSGVLMESWGNGDFTAANEAYTQAYADIIYKPAQTMSLEDYTKHLQSETGATAEQAAALWDRWAPDALKAQAIINTWTQNPLPPFSSN